MNITSLNEIFNKQCLSINDQPVEQVSSKKYLRVYHISLNNSGAPPHAQPWADDARLPGMEPARNSRRF